MQEVLDGLLDDIQVLIDEERADKARDPNWGEHEKAEGREEQEEKTGNEEETEQEQKMKDDEEEGGDRDDDNDDNQKGWEEDNYLKDVDYHSGFNNYNMYPPEQVSI